MKKISEKENKEDKRKEYNVEADPKSLACTLYYEYDLLYALL